MRVVAQAAGGFANGMCAGTAGTGTYKVQVDFQMLADANVPTAHLKI
jgi:hypothetical protein